MQEQLQDFFKALELIKAGDVFDMGLIIKRNTQIDFSYINQMKRESIFVMSSDKYCTKKIIEGLENAKWIIVEIDNNLPQMLYSQLKLLSKNNKIQINEIEGVVDIKQSEKTRIVVLCDRLYIKKLEREYPDFRTFFGPIIEIK